VHIRHRKSEHATTLANWSGQVADIYFVNEQHRTTLKSDWCQPPWMTTHAADRCDATVVKRNRSSCYLRVVDGMVAVCRWLAFYSETSDGKCSLLRWLSLFCIVCPALGVMSAYVCSCNLLWLRSVTARNARVRRACAHFYLKWKPLSWLFTFGFYILADNY